jgi:outer membrane lipoprotein carrier protein lolA
MKQIKYLLLLVAILMANNTFAQSAAKAKECLDKATAIVSNQSGITARFTISSPSMGHTSGSISVKGTKFVATTPQATIWFNGKTQWTYMKSTNEVNVSNPTEAQRVAMNPYALMTLYRQGYDLSMTSQGGSYVVHMKAANAKRSVSEAYVTVSKGYQLQGIKMKQGGKWTTIKVSSIQRKSLSDGIFNFNKKHCPSAEVVDLR